MEAPKGLIETHILPVTLGDILVNEKVCKLRIIGEFNGHFDSLFL